MARDNIENKATGYGDPYFPKGHSWTVKASLTGCELRWKTWLAEGWSVESAIADGYLVKSKEPAKLTDAVTVNINLESSKQTASQEANINSKGEENMTQRKLVTVNLWDDDKALDVEHSLVHSFTNVLTEDDGGTIIQQLIVDQDVKGVIEKHNAKRIKQVNKDIQNRTGKKVNLESVKLKHLRWEIV